jgi:DNA repair exonuclease SbcCD ATPase subunit
MRLISITVRNYRIHRELTVELDPRRTVIGGPNETGKSTLAEAAHRALFLKAKGNAKEHRAMKSDLHGGHPEVDVRFEVGGREYAVTKKFSGVNGTTLLTEIGGGTWHNTDAEQRLLKLLGAEDAGASAKDLLNHWGHLWAWQGKVADAPLELANAKGDDLVSLLQAEGSAVLQMSPQDRHVADVMECKVADIFKQNGEPKTNSAYGLAIKDAADTQANLEQAEDHFRKLEDAITGYQDAERILAEQGNVITRLEEEKSKLVERDENIRRLQQAQFGQSGVAQKARDEFNAIQEANRSIADCRDTIKQLEDALAPGREVLKGLIAAKEKAAADWKAEQEALDQANEAARIIRKQHELARDYVEFFKQAESLASLKEKWSQAEDLRKAIAVDQKKLARLPGVDTGSIEHLQELEGNAKTLETKLDATAARIELLAGEMAVSVDGIPLTLGQPTEITGDADLTVGDVAHLKISPGGGDDLDTLRQQAVGARKSFTAALRETGVDSISHAVNVRAERDQLVGRQQTAEAQRDGLSSDGLKQQLGESTAHQETLLEKLNAELERALDFSAPQDRKAAETLENKLSKKLDNAEITESTRRAKRNRHLNTKTKSEEKENAKRNEISGQETELNGEKAQLEAMIKIHGKDKPRSAKLRTLLTTKNSADQQLEETEAELKKLQPDSYPADYDRNQRALKNAQEAGQQADIQKGISQGIFTTDGSANPKAEKETADMRAQTAHARLANEERQALSTQLLDRLFQEQKQLLDDQYGNLFADKVAEYLSRLYGDGTSASIQSGDNDFDGLSINRPTLGDRSFSFDVLSGGTQEQTAVALRLAMAEILAAGHDGCLPVVLDDAFANSDPGRVERIQAMLDHAAVHGLQVIILTCNPAEYSALGAHSIKLSPVDVTPNTSTPSAAPAN